MAKQNTQVIAWVFFGRICQGKSHLSLQIITSTATISPLATTPPLLSH
ncbi:hypothetical protein [Moraxella lacunata]